MKKWKLIVITAILCMTVGMQALASEVPTEVTEPVENELTENTDQNETPADNGETEFVTNLPKYESSNDWVSYGKCTAVCKEGNVELPSNTLRSSYTISQESISQEEAQRIFGSGKVYKIGAIDFKPAYMKADSSLNGKTVKEVIIQDLLIVETRDEFITPDLVKTGDAERVSKELKVLYFPSGGTSYKECTITKVDTDGRLFLKGFEGTVLPLDGARFVFISGNPENTSTEPESTPSSDSGSSGEPEVYSQGATMGEIGVKKSGAGVQAHVRKANGEETNVIVHPHLNPGTKTLTQAQARQMLGTSFACNIYSFDLSIVNAQEDYGAVTLIDGSVPVTFFVPGVTPESKVALRHWINGSGTYEDLPVEVGNGIVKAEFTSFSPVVIVVEQPGVTAAAANGPVSPKTGENSIIYAVEALALLSLLGLFTCRRKRQA